MTKAKSTDFLKSMKDAIKKVLDDKETTGAERVKAVQAGIALLEFENEQDGGKKDDGHFFSGKR